MGVYRRGPFRRRGALRRAWVGSKNPGVTRAFSVATTGTSAPVFTLAGMVDTFAVAATGKSTPVFTLAGMTDPFAFAATGRSVPAFTFAGMTDVFAVASTGASTPSFGVVSVPAGGVTNNDEPAHLTYYGK